MQRENGLDRASRFQRIGLILAFSFFIASVVVVHTRRAPQILKSGVTHLTVAHYAIEAAGEGWEAAIKEFERMKEREGVKVKIDQSHIPVRAYQQWFRTQLVGGDPADILMLSWSPESPYYSDYFVSLSPYVDLPNPYNANTPLEGLPWRDTFVDGMEKWMGRDPGFGISYCFQVMRLYGNLDLIEAATGKRAMPQTVEELLEAAGAVREYGRKTAQPLVPIGYLGVEAYSVSQALPTYFSQFTGSFIDQALDGTAQRSDILRAIKDDPRETDRVLAVIGVLREIGQYFAQGFTMIDPEQSLFLFTAGRTGFLFWGSWMGGTLDREGDFELGIVPYPKVSEFMPYAKYFTGSVSESGVPGYHAAFGITRASRQFPLALEFLQYISSYEGNQLSMSYPKWAPIVKKARFEGLVRNFKPVMEGNTMVPWPFYYGSGTVQRRTNEKIEEIIIQNRRNYKGYFLDGFRSFKSNLEENIQEAIISHFRTDLVREFERSRRAIALFRQDITAEERAITRTQEEHEFIVYCSHAEGGRVGQLREFKKYLEAVRTF